MEEFDNGLFEDLASLMDATDGPEECQSNVKKLQPKEECDSMETMKAKLREMEAKMKLYEKQLSQSSQKCPTDTKVQSETDTIQSKSKANTLITKQPISQSKWLTDTSQSRAKEFIFGKKEKAGNQKSLLDDVGNQRENSGIGKRKSVVDLSEMPNKRTAYDTDLFEEKYTGLRLLNPLVSSVLMDQRMEGRRFVKLHQLSSVMVNGDIQGNWVTGGVLVEKMPPRTSSNGKPFSIWKLSSLIPGHENKIISLFLFGKCHLDLWKTQEGMCAVILNPSILPPKGDQTIKGTAISIDNSQRLMPLGVSKDYGVCKGVIKKNGSKCKNYVNRSYGDFCEYHIQNEYKKSRANRMEFQFGYGAPTYNPNKGKMMQKLKKNIDDGQYFYGGEVVTLGAPKDKKKVTLKSMMSPSIQAEAKNQLKQSSASQPPTEKKDTDACEDFKQLLHLPTAGTRNLMRHLKKDEEEEEKAKGTTKIISITPSQLLKMEKVNLQKRKEARSVSTEKKPISMPLLARGCAPDEDIEFADCGDVVSNSLGKFSEPCNFYKKKIVESSHAIKKVSPSYSQEQAKRKAMRLWKERNIDEDNNENDKVKNILKKVMDNRSHQEGDDNLILKSKKPKGLLSGVFGAIDLNSEEGRKILNAKSSHVNLIKEDEIRRSDLYFKALEKKEMYEEKLQNITELKVTAVCCKQCKYLAESASKLCQDEKHMIVKVEAKKRFFSCKKCKQRTYALNDKIPNHPCRNCGEMNYERVSMYKEKQGPKLERETLLLRGEEHSKFLNSLT